MENYEQGTYIVFKRFLYCMNEVLKTCVEAYVRQKSYLFHRI